MDVLYQSLIYRFKAALKESEEREGTGTSGAAAAAGGPETGAAAAGAAAGVGAMSAADAAMYTELRQKKAKLLQLLGPNVPPPPARTR